MLKAWFEDLIREPTLELPSRIVASGESRKVGDISWHVYLELSAEPAEQIAISILDPKADTLLTTTGFTDHIVFGVIDAFVILPPRPIRGFKIEVLRLESENPEFITPKALRQAARNCANKMLSSLRIIK